MNLATRNNQETQSLDFLIIIQAFTNLIIGSSRSLLNKVVKVIAMPFLLIGLYLFMAYIVRKVKKDTTKIQNTSIETDEDFRSSKKRYSLLKKATSKKISKEMLTRIPFYIRIALKPFVSFTLEMDKQKEAIKNQIYAYSLVNFKSPDNVIQLGSVEDYHKLIDVIENPAKPNSSLEKAALRHKELFG